MDYFPSVGLWIDARRLPVPAVVGRGGLCGGSSGLNELFNAMSPPVPRLPVDDFAVLWGTPGVLSDAHTRRSALFLTTRSSVPSHNDQNRTTPGTNLLPSINHARVARRVFNVAVRAGVGWC
jgi:hypothetical protein